MEFYIAILAEKKRTLRQTFSILSQSRRISGERFIRVFLDGLTVIHFFFSPLLLWVTQEYGESNTNDD